MKYRNLLPLLIILSKNRIYSFKFTIKISLIVFALIWLMGEHLQDKLHNAGIYWTLCFEEQIIFKLSTGSL